ncbi:MAG: LON peptidase substrate-binding domain-containing protein [Chloroflexota bacterium]|nr:LON peptidase substrate-binding domain-containing protein [Chloroflexota bacterium]
MDGPNGERLPLFPLGVVLFPGMLLPLHLFEERYRRLMHDRQGSDPIFGVVLTRHGREVGDRPEIHRVGTAGSLVGAGRYPDGRYDVVLRGGRRFRVEAEDWDAGYLMASVTWLDGPEPAPVEDGARDLAAQVTRAYAAFVDLFAKVANVEVPQDDLGGAPTEVAYAVSARLPLNTWERQALLEEPTTEARLERLLTILRRERTLLEEGAGGPAVERPGTGFLAN